MASTQFSSIQLLGSSIKAATVLTNAYTGFVTSVVDLESYDSCSIAVVVGSPESGTGRVARIKVQWSQDNSTFIDEPSETAAASSGSEQPYVPYSRVELLDLDSTATTYTGVWITRERRVARYMKIVAKSSATTTATLAVTIQKMCNGN